MSASFVHSGWFTTGANVWQWVFSIIAIVGWPVAGYTYWHHRCHEKLCVRPGQVPVKGTHMKVCVKHAKEKGHTH